MIRKANNETHGKRIFSATFVFVCLLLVCVSSALAVVSVAHKSRDQVGVLERLNSANIRYESELSRLKLELSTLAEFSRVEARAADILTMKRVKAADMVVSQ